MSKVDWKWYLTMANKALKDKGAELVVSEEDGCYQLDIKWQDGETNNYAGGYYESELADLINDAWNFASSESLKHADRTIREKDQKLFAFEKQTFDIISENVKEVGALLDRDWKLTYSREYSYNLKNIYSRCMVMDGDKQILKTGVYDDVSQACMAVKTFLEGVKAVLEVEQEDNYPAVLSGKDVEMKQ